MRKPKTPIHLSSAVAEIPDTQWSKYISLSEVLAHKYAADFRSPAVTQDFRDAATDGLLNAMKSFDPSKNTSFKTYAFRRMRGAILDHMREMDTLPREDRAWLRSVFADDSVTSSEVSAAIEALHLPQERKVMLQQAAERRLKNMNSFEPLHAVHEVWASTKHTPEQHAINTEIHEKLASQLDALPAEQRIVLQEHFYHDRTLDEIAPEMELHPSRLSQLKQTALKRLRTTDDMPAIANAANVEIRKLTTRIKVEKAILTAGEALGRK